MGLLERYEGWVRSNAAAVVAAEGALSSLTWLVPDRFADSELTLEALNSVLGLLSMYHGRIWAARTAPMAARSTRRACPGRCGWARCTRCGHWVPQSEHSRSHWHAPPPHLRPALLSSKWRNAPARLPQLLCLSSLPKARHHLPSAVPSYKRKSDHLHLLQPPVALNDSAQVTREDKGCRTRAAGPHTPV